MPLTRPCTALDRSELASLWSLRFGDSEGFVEWFFRYRFRPESSVCLEESGRIVSVIHGWPMRLRLRGHVLPAMMLCGVATLPGFEGRGHMHAAMRAMLRLARAQGIPLVFHKPNRLSVYASLSQLPCTDTLHHTVGMGAAQPAFSGDWDAAALLDIYRAASSRYSGCVVRDEAAM
ncbi:MAG: GNAT family N-acetyltransferase, partial [Clostridia bacterium]|nr:GNAT family N-acetyltransferase [Clostridia bacterium]